jgi:hypothetical protein
MTLSDEYFLIPQITLIEDGSNVGSSRSTEGQKAHFPLLAADVLLLRSISTLLQGDQGQAAENDYQEQLCVTNLHSLKCWPHFVSRTCHKRATPSE